MQKNSLILYFLIFCRRIERKDIKFRKVQLEKLNFEIKKYEQSLEVTESKVNFLRFMEEQHNKKVIE